MLLLFPKKGNNDNVKTRWYSTIAIILVLLVLLLLNMLYLDSSLTDRQTGRSNTDMLRRVDTD